MDVIYLDQPTAATMTNMKSLVAVYRKHNSNGKFDDNITRYTAVYNTMMAELLGR